MLNDTDETEVALYQESAENYKLRLMLQLQNGKDIPAEELTQLVIQEQKLSPTPKEKTKLTNGTGRNEDDVLTEMMRETEKVSRESKEKGEEVEEIADELLNHRNKKEPDSIEGGPNENEQHDMLAQFLKENEIVEQMPEGGDYENQEEDLSMFRKGKRRDSF